MHEMVRWNIFSINSKTLSFNHYPSDQILNKGYRHIIRSFCSINPSPLGFSIKSIFEFTCSYDMQPARRTSVPHPPLQLFNSIIIPWISQLIYICFMGYWFSLLEHKNFNELLLSTFASFNLVCYITYNENWPFESNLFYCPLRGWPLDLTWMTPDVDPSAPDRRWHCTTAFCSRTYRWQCENGHH